MVAEGVGVVPKGAERSVGEGLGTAAPDDASRIPVIVVDRQRLVRSGIGRLIADDPAFHIVGLSEGDADLPLRCATIPRGVVVMDIDLGPVDGIDLIRTIRATSPGPAVLVVAALADWRVIPAMRAGASGFLLKDTEPESLRSAVASVHRGQQVVCREASHWLIRDTGGRRNLTPQEEIVLQMVGQGARNREIAERLDIGEKTVRNYVSRLYRKLAVDDRAKIASYARHARIVADEATADRRSPRSPSLEGVR